MLTLFGLAVIGILILMIMAVVGNTSPTGITAIENQIFLMNCPLPLNGAIANNTNISGLTVTYDIIYDNATSDYHLTIFHCEIVNPTTPLYGASTEVLTTANNWFDVGFAYLGYIMNGITATLGKLQAFLTIFSYIIAPANFSILGYTLADLTGIANVVIVGLYIVSYVFIGAWLWVVFNPFKMGGGG